MNERELEQALRLLAAERISPGPKLLEKTKARLRRSRFIPWLLAASLASQTASVIGGYWLLFVFQAGWLFKALWLSALAAAVTLPLVLLTLRLREQELPPNRA
jgi:hypothetical protein